MKKNENIKNKETKNIEKKFHLLMISILIISSILPVGIQEIQKERKEYMKDSLEVVSMEEKFSSYSKEGLENNIIVIDAGHGYPDRWCYCR